MKRFFFSFLLFGLFLTGTESCKKDLGAEEKTFNRVEMLTAISDSLIYPTHLKLVSNSINLLSSVNTFCSIPTIENLTALQSNWKKTTLNWNLCEIFVFGKVKNSFLNFKIDSWPVNKTGIENLIQSDTLLTDSMVSSLGLNFKGLHGIEALIFHQDGNQIILDKFNVDKSAKNRKFYLATITNHLAVSIKRLYQIWSREGENYLLDFSQMDGVGLESSLSLLINSIVQQLESIIHKRLGIPMGNKNNGIPQPELAESRLSEASFSNIQYCIKSIITIIIGNKESANDNIPFLKSYLDALDAKHENDVLSNKIIIHAVGIENSLKNFNNPLHEAVISSKPEVNLLKEKIRELLILFKIDVASQLSITITPTDNDGD